MSFHYRKNIHDGGNPFGDGLTLQEILAAMKRRDSQ